MKKVQGFSKSIDIKNTIKSGKRTSSIYFNSYLTARQSQKLTINIAVAASKKIGNAVERNKIKRRIKQVFREEQFLKPVELNIVVTVKKKANEADYWIIKEELNKILYKYI